MNKALLYALGVGCALSGVILYNYSVSHDSMIIASGLLIGLGIILLWFSYF